MINVKTDKEVKNNARKLAEELGLSLSDIVNVSLRNFIRTREIKISTIPQITPELETLLGVVEQDLKTGNNLSEDLATSNDINRYLDSL